MLDTLAKYARELEWAGTELDAIEAEMDERRHEPNFDEAAFEPRFHAVRLANRRVKDGLRRDDARRRADA